MTPSEIWKMKMFVLFCLALSALGWLSVLALLWLVVVNQLASTSSGCRIIHLLSQLGTCQIRVGQTQDLIFS